MHRLLTLLTESAVKHFTHVLIHAAACASPVKVFSQLIQFDSQIELKFECWKRQSYLRVNEQCSLSNTVAGKMFGFSKFICGQKTQLAAYPETVHFDTFDSIYSYRACHAFILLRSHFTIE